MKSKVVIIIIVLISILILALGIGGFSWYSSSLKPVSSVSVEENETIRIEIKEGMGISKIAELLEESNVIRSANSMKIYAKINNIGALQAGKYDLNNSENMPTEQINSNELDISILDLLVKIKIAPSKGQAKTLVEQGGITIDDNKITDIKHNISKELFNNNSIIVKKGKKTFIKVELI